jgi:hypothetical protein
VRNTALFITTFLSLFVLFFSIIVGVRTHRLTLRAEELAANADKLKADAESIRKQAFILEENVRAVRMHADDLQYELEQCRREHNVRP